MSRLRPLTAHASRVRLSVVAAAVGLVVSIVLFAFGFVVDDILVRGVPLAIGIGCVLYLASAQRNATAWEPGRMGVPLRTPTTHLVVIGLAGLVTVAALTGGRGTPFLFLAWAVGSLILAQIVFTPPESLDHRVVLFEIVAFALVVRFAALYTTPGLVGIDIWTHVASFAAAIQREQSLAAISATKYYNAPFYHLLTVVAADVLGTSLRTGLYLILGTTLSLVVVFVYTAARYVTDVRWALFAAMVFSVADRVIEWGIAIETTSLGLVFFLVVVFLLVRSLYVPIGPIDAVLLVGFASAVTLTHQVSAFITIVLLGTATAAHILSGHLTGFFGHERLDERNRYLPAVFAGHLTFTAAIWAVTPWEGDTFMSSVLRMWQAGIGEGTGFLALADPTPTGVGGPEATGVMANLATYVDNLGLILFLLITILGSLALLRHTRSTGPYALVGSIFVMLVFCLGVPLFGFTLHLPERWYPFMYALMAIAGAIGVKYTVTRLPARAVVVGLVVFLLIFPGTMLLAHPATYDDPTFEDQWIKYAYSESEIAAAETFRETVPEAHHPIRTDAPYFQITTRINEDLTERDGSGHQYSALWLTVTDDDRTAPFQDFVVYRTYQAEGYTMFQLMDGSYDVRDLTRDQVCPQTTNHVYATEDVILCTDRDA